MLWNHWRNRKIDCSVDVQEWLPVPHCWCSLQRSYSPPTQAKGGSALGSLELYDTTQSWEVWEVPACGYNCFSMYPKPWLYNRILLQKSTASSWLCLPASVPQVVEGWSSLCISSFQILHGCIESKKLLCIHSLTASDSERQRAETDTNCQSIPLVTGKFWNIDRTSLNGLEINNAESVRLCCKGRHYRCSASRHQVWLPRLYTQERSDLLMLCISHSMCDQNNRPWTCSMPAWFSRVVCIRTGHANSFDMERKLLIWLD